MMRFAIVRHGQSGAINDYIGLNLFEEMPNVRFIPYICFDETIILPRYWEEYPDAGSSPSACIVYKQINHLKSGVR